MVRELQIPTQMTSALKRIADMFVESFAQVGDKIHKDIRDQYRDWARQQFDSFVEAVKTRTGPFETTDYRGRRHTPYEHRDDWLIVDKEAKKRWGYKRIETWEDWKQLRPFELTYKIVDQKADEAYERARDSFVFKNLDKMKEILGKRTDLKNAVTKFDLRRNALAGNVQLYLENVYIRADVGLKYVVRTIPNLTPYLQYPLVFVEADINGKHYARPSEQELRNLLSGKTDEQHAAEKAAEQLAAGFCPGSGKHVSDKVWRQIYNRMSKYTTCPDCGQGASVSSGGNFLKHKTKAAVKLSAAQKLTESGYCPMSKEKVPADVVAKIGPVDGYKDPKGFCPGCKQQVRMQAETEWIRDRFLSPSGYPTKAMVTSAHYLKHKLAP
jgi:hypothetical protein